MRKAEQTLLTKLQSDKSANIPLAEVKKSLGSVRYAVGNPLSKTEIALTISIVYGNLGVGVVAPVAIPVAAQTRLPVWLFGLTDYYSGYLKMNTLLNPTPAWQRNANLGISNVPMGIYGFNFYTADLFMLPFLATGDMVLCFNFAPTNIYGLVIIHCNNVAYGTFLNSFVSDLITIDMLRFIVNAVDILQFTNPVIFGTQTLFGKVKTDNIDPRKYIKPTMPQQQISDIPLDLPIDKSLMIGFNMNFDCNPINIVMFVKKVESLTHKKIG